MCGTLTPIQYVSNIGPFSESARKLTYLLIDAGLLLLYLLLQPLQPSSIRSSTIRLQYLYIPDDRKVSIARFAKAQGPDA